MNNFDTSLLLQTVLYCSYDHLRPLFKKALYHLQMNGVCHRDISLENILVDQHGYIRLIYYGLAKMLQGGEDA